MPVTTSRKCCQRCHLGIQKSNFPKSYKAKILQLLSLVHNKVTYKFPSTYNLWCFRSCARKDGKLPVSREERFCRYCHEVLQTEVVESEQHVLNDCPLYVKHRLKFMSFSSLHNTLAVTEICRTIFTDAESDFDKTSKKEICFQLSKFCYNIFEHRKIFHNFLDDYVE